MKHIRILHQSKANFEIGFEIELVRYAANNVSLSVCVMSMVRVSNKCYITLLSGNQVCIYGEQKWAEN